MLIYKKRNRTDSGVGPDTAKEYTARQELELVLKLKKEELFDPYVLLPHAELNEAVYRSVNTFVEKYKGDSMTVTILSDPLNEAVRDTFREVYRAHYEDEYKKTVHYLQRRMTRFLILLCVSISAFFIGDWLGTHIAGYNVFLNIIANVGAFCLWEVGYTHFATRDAVEEKKRIKRALNAKIEFP